VKLVGAGSQSVEKPLGRSFSLAGDLQTRVLEQSRRVVRKPADQRGVFFLEFVAMLEPL
jgi:hypothetical protein